MRARDVPAPAPQVAGPWAWVEPHDGQPGYWTDDDVEQQQLRAAGVLVLTAVDGRIEGVEGCAHQADLMALAGRVQRLEAWIDDLMDDRAEGAIIAEQYRHERGG